MIVAGRPAKILLIDTNVYFSKRLSDALKREGFTVACSTQPAFALTTLEYDAPSAIVCSTNMREMGALDIARMIRADAKNAALPIIALGDGSQRALMEAFQAGCDDYIDRQRPPAVIATHIKNIIISKAEGFQPTQMLPQSDTSLSGSLSHHDLPGVMQMLGHAHQTGALHINSGDTDALLFFDAGVIIHAECASLFGDEAVIHILKNCFRNNSGVYKFVYGSTSSQHTVLRSATDLMIDAMREVDESARDAQEAESSVASEDPVAQASLHPPASSAEGILPASSFEASLISPEPSSSAPEFDESSIATLVEHFETPEPMPAAPFLAPQPERAEPISAADTAATLEQPAPHLYHSSEFVPSAALPVTTLPETNVEQSAADTSAQEISAPETLALEGSALVEPQPEAAEALNVPEHSELAAPLELPAEPEPDNENDSHSDPLANYQVAPLIDIEDIT